MGVRTHVEDKKRGLGNPDKADHYGKIKKKNCTCGSEICEIF
jgi:hypothetical protein